MGHMGQERAAELHGHLSKCVFCGSPNAAQSHVWPSWIDKLFPNGQLPRRHDPASPQPASAEQDYPRGAGSERAPLACAACTEGWIESLGNRASAFLEPVLNGGQVDLSPEQAGVLAGCMCLVAMKTAMLTGHCDICPGDRAHLRHTGQPPKNWSIFIAGLSGTAWSRNCLHHSYRVEFAGNPLATRTKDRAAKPCNTQLMSTGIGPLFFHMFSTPSLLLLSEFADHARQQGLTQLWPLPRRFGLLPPGPIRVPPSLALTDDQARTLADTFADCLQRRLRQVMASAA